MKFLILNTDYPEFLRWLYAQHPGLENAPYEKPTRAQVHSPFWVKYANSRCIFHIQPA
jgi:hypothetical protein